MVGVEVETQLDGRHQPRRLPTCTVTGFSSPAEAVMAGVYSSPLPEGSGGQAQARRIWPATLSPAERLFMGASARAAGVGTTRQGTRGASELGSSLGVGLGIHRSRTCMRSLLEGANAQRIDGPTKASRIRLKSKPRKISCSGRQLARGTLSCLCPDRQRSSVISHVRILVRDYARFAAKFCRKMVSRTDICELLH